MGIEELTQLVNDGHKAAKERHRLHAAYQEALEKQQAVREQLRKDSIRALGRADRNGILKKRDDITIRYGGPAGYGYYVACQDFAPVHPPEGARTFGKAEAIVAAYLRYVVGLSHEMSIKGALI